MGRGLRARQHRIIPCFGGAAYTMHARNGACPLPSSTLSRARPVICAPRCTLSAPEGDGSIASNTSNTKRHDEACNHRTTGKCIITWRRRIQGGISVFEGKRWRLREEHGPREGGGWGAPSKPKVVTYDMPRGRPTMMPSFSSSRSRSKTSCTFREFLPLERLAQTRCGVAVIISTNRPRHASNRPAC